MKIAIPSLGRDKTSLVNERFGRAENFIIYDTTSNSYEVLENSENKSLQQGSGTQTAETIIKKNVNVLLASNVGPKALKVLELSNIKVFTIPSGITVEKALNLYNEGALTLS
ncbi:MAG: dinitrogenase iron-molybdenum cofactor biosynthesis protein [Thermoanaerobaculaceae bacterium]|nr:dinitrogenase iron-molybdenum cofactor biosynthesis protein [Thermoanaerobaculaceae bacterium]